MGAFEYQALDQRGRKKKGIIESDTPRQARQLLRERGLNPLALESVLQKKGSRQAGLFGGRHLKIRDLTLVTRQLATLSRSGMPLEETLTAVSQQSEKNSVRRIVMSLRTQVLEGQSLATACDQFPNAFPTLYRATVAAGESSGKLDLVLERLADHLENKEKIRQKVQLALIYPVLLTLISLLVVVGLLTYVIPQIVGVFNNLGQELPMLTRALIQASDFLRAYGFYIPLGLLLLWLIFRLLLRQEGFRRNLHRRLLRLPLIGRFSRSSNSARFTRTLAILSSSGVELLEALQIAGKVIPNLAMKNAVFDAASQVREGSSLSRALEQSKLFPPLTVHLIASGEASGELTKMLESAAENQEREMQSFTEMVVGIFEPMLILVMGGIVLIIVISVLLPIFEMNQLVH